jgi:hypothetical protein
MEWYWLLTGCLISGLSQTTLVLDGRNYKYLYTPTIQSKKHREELLSLGSRTQSLYPWDGLEHNVYHCNVLTTCFHVHDAHKQREDAISVGQSIPLEGSQLQQLFPRRTSRRNMLTSYNGSMPFPFASIPDPFRVVTIIQSS